MTNEVYPITFLEWNLRDGVDQIQPNDIASYAYPVGVRERYTDCGWAKALRRGIVRAYVYNNLILEGHKVDCRKPLPWWKRIFWKLR